MPRHKHEWMFIGTRTIGDFGITKTEKLEVWQCDVCKEEKEIEINN